MRALFDWLLTISFPFVFQGQTESKRSTKVKGPETKGTAMSFGFKKKSLPVYTGTTKKIPAKPETTAFKLERDSDDNGNNGNGECLFYF